MDNVLLVTIDSLRADHVGYHGYERNVTPNIDEYAREGSRFMNTHAHVGGTRFSFPSILSGVTTGMYGGYERVSDEQTLISELFRNAGFNTGGFTCNLYVSGEFGYNRGWDTFFDSAPDESATSKLRKWAKTNLDGLLLNALQRGYDFLESNQGINVGSYHVPADKMTDRAVDFIKQNGDEPTFVWLHYMDVHHPFLPPEEFQREFRDDIITDRESVQLRRKFLEEPENVTDEEYQMFIDLYDAEIKFNDAEIGRLMETVEAEWGEDYLFALTADHGDHFLEHGYFGGARLRDVKTHVPLFIEGWEDNGEYDDLVGLADVPATLADHAGLEIPESYFGQSLRKLVFEGIWDRTEVLGSYTDQGDEYHAHIRTEEWNLATHTDADDELYQVEKAFNERKNVIDEYPSVESQLQDRLADHRQLVRSTGQDDVERPDVNENVKERLRRLGYDE